MAKTIKENVFVDVFVLVIAAILVITGYLVMILMTGMQQDNVARGVLLLALLTIVSSMIQLAMLAMLGKIRQNLKGGKQ
ncbi:MAG: hypothetical protein HY051_00140 [Candidatus Aenigmarchaeota archaeon]|nr:hypothetical protein [Candidatus Aenigmarchaeota archaeon]